MEFKKIKQEIEEEIKKESKSKKKHYKSLFSSINDPLAADHVSTRRLKLKKPKESQSKSKTKRKCEDLENSDDDRSISKVNIRKFIREKQKKNKVKETLEKSQEIEKHQKIHDNLKVLNAYIKKIRKHPVEPGIEIVNQAHDCSIKYDDLNRSDRQSTKRTNSKKSRRANNRSRLYEDEQKIFEDIMKHKNNQSLDTKIDKHIPGHLKYTTLLKDKKQEKKNKTSHEIHKDGKVKKNKYFSAPVSTKENGLVTKFKFHDKKNDTQKLVAKDSTAKLDDRKFSASSKGSYKRGKKLKVTPVQSDSQLINIESKTPNSGRDMEVNNLS